jgi:endonuclease/exonuclease/phosphatase family metal-dependent hydrolase
VTRLPVLVEDIRDPHDRWAVNAPGAIARYEVEWAGRPLSVLLVHMSTVRRGLEELPGGVTRHGWQGPRSMRENIALRDDDSRLSLEWARRASLPTIVMGDFNIPVDSAIYRRYWSGYHNALSEMANGHPMTKMTRWWGIRIDHVLFSSDWMCRQAFVADDLGMDHRPVVADLVWATR